LAVLTFMTFIVLHDNAIADTVYFHNGDKLTGDVLPSKSEQTLQLRTGFGQDITISWSQIKSVHKKKASGIVIKPPHHTNNTSPPPKALPAKIVKKKTEQKTPPIKITGRVNFGSNIQTGNSEKSSVDTDLSLKTKIGSHRFRAKADYNRAKDEGEVTVDKAQAELIYDYFFREKWFLNSNIGLAQNEISNLDLRITSGLGIGHQAYERDNLNLQYILGATYLREEFSDDTSERNVSMTWSADYNQKIFDDKYQIFHEHKILAPSDDINAFLFESKSGLRIPLIKGIIGTVGIDFDWDNDPPIDTKEDDTIYNMKLGYEW